VIVLLAVPIVIQVYTSMPGIAYGLNRALGVPHNIACPSALIGALVGIQLGFVDAERKPMTARAPGVGRAEKTRQNKDNSLICGLYLVAGIGFEPMTFRL